MKYVSLYRKYRPSTFDEVVGQEYIIKTLINSIKNNKLSHAYLFAGPRGTGKTSVAKLVAKVINCENREGINFCDQCQSCIAFNKKNNPDIIEMDAASNNGVDDIRKINNHVGLLPSMSKYKVYIIDEVHMLSKEAFNALLKTLEEPPEHVVFVLATTELYKVPDTIISRCQTFEFERIKNKEIVDKLNSICNKEKFKCSNDVLLEIAKYSFGGLRDAIGMLDKLSVYSDEMSLDNFYKIKGIMSENDVKLFVEDILAQDMNKIVDNFDKIMSSSINIDNLLFEILKVFKNKLINDVNKNLGLKDFLFEAISIINNSLIDMKKTLYPQIMFEVCILKIMDLYMNQSTINIVEEKTEVFEKQEKFVPKAKKEELKEVEKKEEFNETKNLVKKVNREEKPYDNKNVLGEIRKIRINNTFCDPNKKLLEDLRIKWINLVDVINDKEFSIVSSYVVDAYICVASQNHLILKVEYSSIVNNAMNNIEKIEDLICKVLNNRYKVVFVTNEEWANITKEYKENFKNKNLDKYKFVEEQEILKKIKENKKESKIVNDATSLFGDAVIEIK